MSDADRKPSDASTYVEPRGGSPITTPLLGWIAGTGEDGALLVDFDGSPGGAVAALVTVPLDTAALAAAVASRQGAVLLFAGGDPRVPIVIGLVQPTASLVDRILEAPDAEATPEALVDGRRVELEGKEEIVLRCGEASITLRANGKIVIRGAYVETYATGVNRIKGGAVRIN